MTDRTPTTGQVRAGEPSDAQVLAAAIAPTGGSAILFAELDTETQDRYLEDAHSALLAAASAVRDGA